MSCIKDHKGKASMMRIGFFVALIVGSIVSLAGAVAMFLDLSHAGTAMTTGLAVIGSGGFAKAVQSKWESNHVAKS